FRWMFCFAILIGMISDPEVIWSWGDILNALTVVVNLTALFFLVGQIVKLTIQHKNEIKINHTIS
ncbi:alanine:cation symporter family protein, partial [candidate division KSB1 bacterium]